MQFKTFDMIVNDKWFDHHFITEFLQKGGEFRENLNKKRYKLADEKLSSRVLNHWHKIGVIDDDRPEGKGWRKFSISEMMWISIVKTLRSFGMDMNSIKKVGNYLKSYNSDKIVSKYCILDFYIAYGIMFKEPVKLAVLNDGQSILCTQLALDTFQQSAHLDFAFISVDINSLMAKGTHKVNLTKYTKSPLEKELVDSLMLEDLKRLKVTVREKNYIIEKERLMQDKTTAKALFNMIEFGTERNIKYGSSTSYTVTETKNIKKEG